MTSRKNHQMQLTPLIFTTFRCALPSCRIAAVKWQRAETRGVVGRGVFVRGYYGMSPLCELTLCYFLFSVPRRWTTLFSAFANTSSLQSLKESFELRQVTGPSRRRAKSFRSNAIKSAMSQMKRSLTCKVNADFNDVDLQNPLLSIMSEDIVCTAYTTKGGSGSVVLSSKISNENGGRFISHGLSNLFPMNKIVDLKPMKIQNAFFAAVACQTFTRSLQFVSIRPMFMDSHHLDDLSKTYEFAPTETLFSLAVTPILVAVGAERKIATFQLTDSHASEIKFPIENVFVLENDGEILFAGTNKGNIHQIDPRTAVKIDASSAIKVGSPLSNLKVSPSHVLASGYDHKLVLYDRRNSATPLVTFEEHKNSCRPHLSLELNDRLGIIAAVGSDSVIRMWSLDDYKLSAYISEEDFVGKDSAPCFVVAENMSAPFSLLVSSGDTLSLYK
ncbi:uncharacterized protein LOC111249034 isoform X2 [Varroa destructor]|uniref:Uncharacterized protein n=1 Tax=Varroa destructor TaxID=109461 RepID=A0A7M7JWA7_VARDE|nr:uncharacterized protein LOC111249034 isoform X2 [Varroa destructor]